MIQIYDPGNTKYDFNGDVTLEPYSCECTMVLNDAWSLELEALIDKEGKFKHIVKEAVISAPTPVSDRQLFRICETEKTDSSVTAIALPIFYDSKDDHVLLDVRPTGKNGQQALDIICAGSKYSGESNITKATTAYYIRKNLMEAINGDLDQSFISRWGGEILYDNYKVIINERVGGDYGARAEFGYNLEGIKEHVDMSNVVTRIIPVAYNGYTLDGNTPWVDSPNIKKYQKVYTRTMEFSDIKLKEDSTEDTEDDENACNTLEELRRRLIEECQKQYAAGADLPEITYEVDMISLEGTEEYKDYENLEKVGLGDDVKCKHHILEIETTARVTELTYDCINRRNQKIKLGKFSKTAFDSQFDTEHKIESIIAPDGSVMAEKVQGILNGIYTQLKLQSTVAKKVNGRAFTVEDLDPDSPLYGCMTWGTQGLQLAVRRTADGRDWDWTTAITAQGIVANAIIAGVLSDKTGTNYWNLDTGEFRLTSKAFTVDGQTVGQIAQNAAGKAEQNAINAAKKELADYANTVTKDLENIQAQVDGQVEDYYYDYEPSMQNIPASQWTTTEERQKHIGDRFFWKSKGYAYRFMENGGVWGWTLLQDTDITKAMQTAQNAKDIADGKRRTFITTPVPPYDIGDLWTNGKDILTCIVSRASGAAYVSSDWEKQNHYTDDTVANQALEEARKAHNLTISLDNDYQGIPADYNGNIADFPTVKTHVTVFYGHDDVSASCTYSVQKSSSVAGSWDNARREYTVTGLSDDTGWVDIIANYMQLFTVTKRFNVAKNKDGAPGANGTSVTIKSKSVTYQVGTSGTVKPIGAWSETIPQVPAGQYLWTKTYVEYSNGEHTESYSVSYKAKDGENGTDGADGKPGPDGHDGTSVTITSKSITYQASASGTTPPTGEWKASIPSVPKGQFLWTRTVVNYSDGTSTTSYSVGYQGTNGADGSPGRTYFMELSSLVVKQSKDNTISPNYITMSAFYRDGTNTARTPYAGRFKIEESTDGNTWKTVYTSSENESSVRHSLYSVLSTQSGGAITTASGRSIGIPRDVIALRCTLYAAGGTTQMLDTQSAAVVLDVDALTHEEIFNLLTKNGEIKGIYQEGNQLYISFTYAKGGALTLGGSGNGNGTLKILNASGAQVGYIDNTGVHFNQGEFAGALKAATGNFSGNLNASVGGTIGGWKINVSNQTLTSPDGNIVLDAKNAKIITSGKNVNGSVKTVISNIQSTFPSVDVIDGTVNVKRSTGGYSFQVDSSSSSQIGFFNPFGDGGSSSPTDRIKVNGNFSATGTKNREVKTQDYDNRLQYCYEMASPMFGDIGEAVTDDSGKCYIYLDDIFLETVNTDIEYQVFLQKEAAGDLWVDQKSREYFVVNGTPELNFAWEIKVKQKDFEFERLNESVELDDEIDRIPYLRQGQTLFEEYSQEQEEGQLLFESYCQEQEAVQ
nr:phage tail spike protein [uncultured Blautia sp.]